MEIIPWKILEEIWNPVGSAETLVQENGKAGVN